MTKQELFEQLAQKHLFHTLEEKLSDSYDFFEVGVLSIKDLLEDAYEAGRQAEKRNAKNRARRAKINSK